MRCRFPRASVCAVLALAVTSCAQVCGDCNGDDVVDVRDVLAGAQHTVHIITLGADAFARCNVAGTLGGPSVPGAVVDVLDAFTIAHFTVGIGAPLDCAMGAIASAGPYDIAFLIVPAQTVSDKRFEVTIGLFDQATGRPAIPSEPVLVTLALDSGLGPLSGSVRQWMRTESMVFGNLIVGAVGGFSLRARGSALDGDALSGGIENLIAAESDLRGIMEAPLDPYDPVRFYFRDHGVDTPASSGTFAWEVIRVSTGAVIRTGSVPLTGQTYVDATLPGMSIPYDLYRVNGTIVGTPSSDSHAVYVPPLWGIPDETFLCTLASGRVDVPYSVDIRQLLGRPLTSFYLLDDQLPPGLTCAPTSGGVITGTPTRPGHYQLVGFGSDAANHYLRVAFGISVFSWRDTEIEAGVDFSQPGPHAVSSFYFGSPGTGTTFWNSWTCEWHDTWAVCHYPADVATMRRVPAVAFIHDVGTGAYNYEAILQRIASHGHVVCSVGNPGYPSGTCTQCGGPGSSTYGFARATGFLNEARNVVYQFALVPITPMFQRINLDNIFWAGHGRGGSTSLLNVVLNPGVARGAMAIMPIDPKAQTCLVPGYLGDTIPQMPILNLSAEFDGDVVWPTAENAMEDAVRSGMDTHVTLYGANHNFVADAPFPAEAPARLCRQEEQDRVADWMLAFLARHARGDLRLEGRLSTGEMTSSGDYAVFGRRNMEGTVLVDDHQTTGPSTNLLGGLNNTVGITVDEVNTHPVGYDFGRTVSHRRMLLTSGFGSNSWDAPPGAPVDAGGRTNVCFRARQYRTGSVTIGGTTGWQSALASWELTLVDSAGQAATVNLLPRMPAPALATPCSSGLPPSTAMDRFHRFCVPLADFAADNPAFDPAAVQSLRMDMTPAASVGTQYLAVDDLRFE